jgi:hypothetical protein
MTSIRIIKHEAIPQTGSYEVCFPDGGPVSFATSMTILAGDRSPGR